MQADREIRRFVREILGCSCPEEIFNKIEYREACDDIPGSKINVGDRLLIYIINMDGIPAIPEVVGPAVQRGIEERDEKGFNRFRLVLASSSPDEIYRIAEKTFIDSACTDEKSHLHVLNKCHADVF